MAHFDSLAHFYEAKAFAETSRARARAAMRLARAHGWGGGAILDVGCGAGTGTLWLAQRGHPITGVDRSEAMITLARHRLAGRPAAEVIRQDMRALALGERRYSLAVCLFDAFNYLASPEDADACLAGIGGLVRPGGTLIIDMLTPAGLRSLARMPLSVAVRSNHLLAIAAGPFAANAVELQLYGLRAVRGMSPTLSEERHTLHGYTPGQIRALWRHNRFSEPIFYAGETLLAADRASWHVFVRATRCVL